ncbi:MAG: FapA family protein [Candidatus Pristimantibacillus lignocellulolyticus]|uniref:FapA family protein n=1 Tax=Candidatus Pristimantibacillus lignocellulolyticus TaxID=2994561 RepID=A0A9J6ZBF8_9BACL|nr:MAG: FapA family protein [Candidatus Pristimantibacillus lignocellulolyticus]
MDKQIFDANINIEISADKLTALLNFHYISDNVSYEVAELDEYIRSKGIVHGILYDNLRLIANDPLVYMKRKIEIAKGTPAGKGIDGKVEFITKIRKQSVYDESSESETIDFKQIKKLDNVNKGQLIAQLVPPSYGQPGISVKGEPIDATLGKSARFKVGKNVVKNGEGNALYSAIDGLISITDQEKINVFPVFEVNGDVDYRIGNIDFVGTVVIRGNVLTGFKIKAVGDIRVIGGVEGADLESEGSIEVTGGIMASGKGQVKAKNNIKCSFIQDANLIAGQNITVSQSIMHSIVRAGHSVECNSSKGLIVGGTIQAGEGVSARTIGNSMSTNTIIEVGVNPTLREEQVELRHAMKEHAENLDRTEKALVILDQMAASGKLTPDRFAMRQKLINTKQQTANSVAEMKDRLFEIEKLLENSEKASVSVKNTVYGGVKIVIGRYTRYIKDSTSNILFKYEDGEIVMLPIY